MIHTLVGKRGRGKTSLAAELMVSGQFDQIFIYDYLGEFLEFETPGYITVANRGFTEFLFHVWDNSRAGVETLLVLDEIANYGKDNPQIDHILRLGRHKQIQVLATSQRFYTIPVICRSQTDLFYCFQITEKRDVDYLKGVVDQRTLDRIIRLEKFQYLTLDLS